MTPAPAEIGLPAQAESPGAVSRDLVRLRLDIGYDGTDFHGWASQPGVRTVQGVLEQALHMVLRLTMPPSLTVAGRTDAGVHARGQVAHLDVPADSWLAAGGAEGSSPLVSATGGSGGSSLLVVSTVAPLAQRRISRVLPADISLHAIGVAPAGFDARFSALWRRYSYRVCDVPARADPVRRRDTLCWPSPLDLDRMNEAAALCLGEHDFAAFCRRREGASTIRHLLGLDWRRVCDGVAIATVTADAFCHNMVRALAGALLPVGDGRRPVTWPAELLAAGIRSPSAVVAPAHPLCLEQVAYPPDAELALRATATRRVRTISE